MGRMHVSSRRVDVLLVSGSFHPREGGAERQLRSVLGRLQEDGRHVGVVTQALPDTARRSSVDGICVRRVGSQYAFQHMPRLGQVVFLLSALGTAVMLRPRCIVSLQMGSASAAAAVAARALGIRHVLRLTGGGTERFSSEPPARAAVPLGRLIARLYDRPSTVVVAPAGHLLADYDDSFPAARGNRRHIPNGVRGIEGRVVKSGEVIWYARAGSQSSTRTMARIASLLPDVKFSVVGRGSVPNLPNVVSLGWRDSPEEVIGRHLVLLNTSEREGMPNTVLQALAWGTRVVGFDNAGMREIARKYPRTVSLVPLYDVASAAAAVRTALVEDPAPPEVVPGPDEVGRIWLEVLS